MFDLLGYETISRVILNVDSLQPEALIDEVVEVAGTQTLTFRLGVPRAVMDLPSSQAGLHLLPVLIGPTRLEEVVEVARGLQEKRGVTGIGLEVELGRNELPDLVERLMGEGMKVMADFGSDPELMRNLVEAGATALSTSDLNMGFGPEARLGDLLGDRPDFPVIYRAGCVSPSVLVAAMECGFAAVELRGTLSQALDGVGLAELLANAVETGRVAFERGWTHPAPGLNWDVPPWHG
ncbi:MAG TPA: hypothetical protein PKE55_10815 [Kiritimatiellia bacterium]|nr:hypothetical protein [Kiritimatiellia bacterium]